MTLGVKSGQFGLKSPLKRWVKDASTEPSGKPLGSKLKIVRTADQIFLGGGGGGQMFSLKHSFLETKSKTFFIVIMMMTGKNVLVLYDELQNVDAYLPSLSNTWKASLKSCSGST